MRAVVHDSYGALDVLRLAEIDKPQPQDDEVLVRVVATTVNRTDCGLRAADPFITRFFTGLIRPRQKVLGTEFSGVVEAVGGNVSEFGTGDEVFGVNADGMGAHAEYLCVKETAPIALKPSGMTFEEAAAVSDGFVLAFSCLSAGDIERRQRVLIYGASGSIGTAAVQIARHFGAHVTAVCRTEHFDLVRSLGADEVIDYTLQDFIGNGEQYDIIFDSVGKLPFRPARRSIAPGGIFLETDLGVGWQNPLWAVTTRLGRRPRFSIPLPKYNRENVLLLKDLIEAGEFRAVIDRTHPLEDFAEATRYVESQQKIGNVVLTVGAA